MKLPKTIYVKKEKDGDDEYLVASEEPEGISEPDCVMAAGEYVLSKEINIINSTKIEKRRS